MEDETAIAFSTAAAAGGCAWFLFGGDDRMIGLAIATAFGSFALSGLGQLKRDEKREEVQALEGLSPDEGREPSATIAHRPAAQWQKILALAALTFSGSIWFTFAGQLDEDEMVARVVGLFVAIVFGGALIREALSKGDFTIRVGRAGVALDLAVRDLVVPWDDLESGALTTYFGNVYLGMRVSSRLRSQAHPLTIAMWTLNRSFLRWHIVVHSDDLTTDPRLIEWLLHNLKHNPDSREKAESREGLAELLSEWEVVEPTAPPLPGKRRAKRSG